MGNPLSTFGYMMQGADKGRQVQQQSDLDAQRILQAGQQTETGQIGLDALRRTVDTSAAVRNAGAAAVNQGKTWSGGLLDMATAAASKGDMQTALQYRQAYSTLEAMGAKDVVHEALTNPTPGERPDLVQVMHQYEKTKDTTGATLGPDGTLTITRASGPPTTLNVGKLAEIMGMIAPPKMQTIPAGGTGVITQPGQQTKTINAPKTYPPGAHVLKIYNNEGQAIGEKLVDDSGKEISSSGAPGGAPAGANVRKDLPVLKDITEGVASLGGDYGQTDMTNPLNPKITLTAKGQQVALVAEQIRLANQNLAPRTIIDMAVNGKPMWKIEDGNRTGVVLYRGQEYPMSTPSAQRGAPAAAPRAPAPAAAPAPVQPAAAAPASPPGLEAVSPGQPAPIVEAPVAAPPVAPSVPAAAQPAGATAGGRHYDTQLEAKSPELKRLGNLLRLRPKNPNLDVQTWIKYAELAQKLGGKGFARGGKVPKVQCHGLG